MTGIRPGTSGSFTSVAQNGTGVTVAGTFGTLTIHNDGSYTYTLTSEDREGGTDVFTYQITDGDGDVDTATLTITVPADPNASGRRGRFGQRVGGEASRTACPTRPALRTRRIAQPQTAASRSVIPMAIR